MVHCCGYFHSGKGSSYRLCDNRSKPALIGLSGPACTLEYWGDLLGIDIGSAGLPKAICTRIPDELGYAAATNGYEIFYDDRLNPIQRKCAIVHELIHVELGHSSRQKESVEMGVRFEAARRLLPVMTGQCANEPTLERLLKL